MATVDYESISLDELRERLDEQTREKLGLGVDDFLGLCQTRSLDLSSPGISRLAILARLLLAARSEQPVA